MLLFRIEASLPEADHHAIAVVAGDRVVFNEIQVTAASDARVVVCTKIPVPVKFLMVRPRIVEL